MQQNWAPHTDDRLTSEIEFKSKEVNQIIAQGEFVGTLKAILTMKQFLEKAPNENLGIWHQSLGGAAGKVEPKKTAFYYRDAIIAQEYLATWNNPKEERENIRWIKELRSALSPYTTGDYVNWPDRQIKDWPTAYYGENFKRLREVKTTYDPFNTFKFPQSIPPYNSGFKKNRGAPFL